MLSRSPKTIWLPPISSIFLVARTVVNNDGKGGSSPDPLVWSSGALS